MTTARCCCCRARTPELRSKSSSDAPHCLATAPWTLAALDPAVEMQLVEIAGTELRFGIS